MPFFKSMATHFPLPSAADLEASHFELQGAFPELHVPRERERLDVRLNWIPSLFHRSPRAINEKRGAMLASRDDVSGRSSTDVESQTSSDASTLLGGEPGERKKSARIGARVVSDAIIGLSDGLTVPFALTAGLSALGNTRVVIFAGMAELTAGAISMGLGGYLGAKSEEESHTATLAETRRLVESSPSAAAASVSDVLAPYELPRNLTEDLQFHLTKSPHLLNFLMHFQHNSPEQEASRAITCALTIACGYFLGGFIPLVPYFLVGSEQVLLALWWSLGVMAVSLFAFGYGKTCFVSGWAGSEKVWRGVKGGVQMVVIGGVAAGCAMGLVRLFDSFAHT